MEFINKYLKYISWGFVIVFSILAWWPTRYLPYHWDSAGFVINATQDLINRNFSPWVVEFSDFAHPPLLMTILGVAWKLFGESKIVSHLVMWPFLPILMLSVGGLAITGKWKNELLKWSVFLIAAVTIGVTPVVLSEYGLIYIDLPSSALGLLAMWLASKRKFFMGSLALAGAVMIKESAFLFGLPMLIFYVLNSNLLEKEMTFVKRIKENWKIIILGIPIAVFGLWIYYHFEVTGWWLYRPGRESPSVPLFDSVVFVFNKLAFEQGRFVILLVAGIAGILNWNKWKSNDWKNDQIKLLIASIFTILLGILMFGWSREFATRYGIGLIGVLVALTMNWVGQVWQDRKIKQWWTIWIMAALLVSSQVIYWRGSGKQTNGMEFSPSPDLHYIDMIKIGQLSAEYLAEKYSEAKIYGSFPEVYQLKEPIQGYVTQPLNFEECKNYQFDPNVVQIVYAHYYSPGMAQCAQVINMYPNELLKKFESNGKWVALFKLKTNQ